MERFSLALLALSAVVASSGCGKEVVGSQSAYTGAIHETSYGVSCIDEPIDSEKRKVDPYSGKSTVFDPELPDQLPVVYTPIEVNKCEGFGGAPMFPDKVMPGLIARVDCNAHVVHFRTRDYQVFEVGRITPAGDVAVTVLYITRLVQDADGATDCWRRFIGNIKGRVDCPAGNPMGAHLDYRVTWTVDPTPSEVMESPTPRQADHRVGKFCKMDSGNCEFSNHVEMGCGG